MKNTIFVRPNLKLFLVGSILILVIQELITSGRSEAATVLNAIPVNAREVTKGEMHELVRLAAINPSAEVYFRLSNCFQEGGDFRKALLYLRRAEKIRLSEDSSE
jgi:hypothetical protein